MKLARVTLGLALVNGILLAVIVWQARQLRVQRRAVPENVARPSASAPAGTPGAASPKPSSSSDKPAENVTPGAGPAAEIAARASTSQVATNWPKFDWRQVESEDYRTYIKNLRAIGCPEQTIRDIVSADVLQAFAARRAEVVAMRYRDFKANEFDETADAGFARHRRALDEAMTEATRQLLGTDAIPPSAAAEWTRAIHSQQLAFLPAGQHQAVMEILTQFGELDLGLPQGISGDRLTPAQAEEAKLRLTAFEQRRASLLALLSPEQYEQVDMTISWTAGNLRQAMARFQPNAEEFREIFQQWRAHDHRVLEAWANGVPDPGNDHVFAAIEEFLGPERYRQYRETWWK
jgi:hypothetical protein